MSVILAFLAVPWLSASVLPSQAALKRFTVRELQQRHRRIIGTPRKPHGKKYLQRESSTPLLRWR